MESRKKPSSDTKLIARHAIGTFGAPPSVWRFTCEREDFSLDIGGCMDRPLPGVVSYTTIGLSDTDVVTGSAPPSHLELAAACARGSALVSQYPGRGGDAAHPPRPASGRPEVKPGDAVRDVIAEFYPRDGVKHLYLTSPFLWGQRLQALRGEAKSIAWLLAVPVTSDELRYLEAQGGDGLEPLYRQRRIDMYSLGRRTWLT